jgi:DNA-binding transcriptional LysR family regulator
MANFEYYRVFYQVAKLGSITLAAEELYISQPAVSQAVKNLETALGGSLFYRTPKGMRLTPEGELLYSYVSQGYEYFIQAESKYRELFELEAGEIRIGASDMTLQYYLLPHLEQFSRLYPKIKIKVTNAPTPDTLEHLETGRIDFGVVTSPVEEGKGRHITPVGRVRDIFAAGSRFSSLKGKTVEVSELQQYPIVCLEQNTSTRRYVDRFMKENGTGLNPEFELATSELIVQFAARGLGIGCVVWNFAEKLIAEGVLFEVRLKTPIPERDICIVTLDRMPISQAGRKLLEILLRNS